MFSLPQATRSWLRVIHIPYVHVCEHNMLVSLFGRASCLLWLIFILYLSSASFFSDERYDVTESRGILPFFSLLNKIVQV